MDFHMVLILTCLLYIPFIYVAVRYRNKKLGHEIIVGSIVAIFVSVACFNTSSLWLTHERTWYWAVICGFYFTALPYASLIMLIKQFKEGSNKLFNRMNGKP